MGTTAKKAEAEQLAGHDDAAEDEPKTVTKDHITERNGSYRVQYRRKGYPPQTATFPRKALAKAWWKERDEEYQRSRLSPVEEHTLGEAMEKFRLEKCREREGGETEKKRLLRLEKDEIAKVPLPRLNSSHLATYRDRELQREYRGKKIQGTSVRRMISLITSVLAAAREWQWLRPDQNPMLGFQRPPPKDGRARGVSQEEIDAIVAALGYKGGKPTLFKHQVAIAFLLSIETAMRASEMLRLTWSNVFPKYVHLKKTKNQTKRDVPLSRRARELIDLMRGIDRVHVFTVPAGTRDTQFREAKNAVNLLEVNFHDARSEAITRLSRKLDPLELARTVGHRDLKSLLLYYKMDPEGVADKLDAPEDSALLAALKPRDNLPRDIARVTAAMLEDPDGLRKIGLRSDDVHDVVRRVLRVASDLVRAPQLSAT